MLGLLLLLAQQVHIYGHRGLILDAPENTLASYRACLRAGAGIEIDVQLTRDRVPVILHDPTVDRTTNGHGRVADLTLSQIKELDAGTRFNARFAGERIPTFEEILRLIHNEDPRRWARIAIDQKETGRDVEAIVTRLLEKYGIVERVLVFGTDVASLARYKRANSRIQVATIANTRDDMRRVAQLAGIDLIWLTRLFPDVPTREDVRWIEARGKAVVQFFATQEPDRWQKAAANGVQHIVTDYPREMIRALSASLD